MDYKKLKFGWVLFCAAKKSKYQTVLAFFVIQKFEEGIRTRALRKQWTPIVFSDDRSALCGIHLYKHLCHTKCKNDPPHLHQKN